MADANFSSVVLGMHMDDTGLTDIKGHTVTLNGNATRSATQAKFGGYSAYFDGTGDYLSIPDSADWYLASSDFTIEAWVRPEGSFSGVRNVVGQWEGAGTSAWSFYSYTGGILGFGYSTSGSYQAGNDLSSSAGVLTLNTWHHVAVVRQGNTITLWVDGNQVATKDVTGITIANTANPLKVGGSDVSQNWIGYIDDLRITKGVARYTTGFTPPTEAFPDGGYTISGTVTTPDSTARTLRIYRRDTGALLASGTSNGTTGAYNISVDYADEVSVVMFDDAAGSIENDQILRTTPV